MECKETHGMNVIKKNKTGCFVFTDCCVSLRPTTQRTLHFLWPWISPLNVLWTSNPSSPSSANISSPHLSLITSSKPVCTASTHYSQLCADSKQEPLMYATCSPTPPLRYQCPGRTCCYLHSQGRTLSSWRWMHNVPPKHQHLYDYMAPHIRKQQFSFLILYTFRQTYCFIATNCTGTALCNFIILQSTPLHVSSTFRHLHLNLTVIQAHHHSKLCAVKHRVE